MRDIIPLRLATFILAERKTPDSPKNRGLYPDPVGHFPNAIPCRYSGVNRGTPCFELRSAEVEGFAFSNFCTALTPDLPEEVAT
jgi:hypothetical protein